MQRIRESAADISDIVVVPNDRGTHAAMTGRNDGNRIADRSRVSHLIAQKQRFRQCLF